MSEIEFPQTSEGAWHVAAYRKWLNLDPFPDRTQAASRRKRQHKATANDLDLNQLLELVALSVKERAARCRLLGSEILKTDSTKVGKICVCIEDINEKKLGNLWNEMRPVHRFSLQTATVEFLIY